MRCREVLLSFVHALSTESIVPERVDRPKLSDFIHWSELVANAVAPGPRAARRRSYLKSLAGETWEIVGWLTHAKNAIRADVDFVVTATAYFLSAFETELRRMESGGPDKCPHCGSYRLADDVFWDDEEDDLIHRTLCEVCDWSEGYEGVRAGTHRNSATTTRRRRRLSALLRVVGGGSHLRALCGTGLGLGRLRATCSGRPGAQAVLRPGGLAPTGRRLPLAVNRARRGGDVRKSCGLGGIALVVALGLAGCSAEETAQKAGTATTAASGAQTTSKSVNTTIATTTIAPTTAVPPTTTTKPVPTPIELQGRGKTATEPFTIAGGLAIFRTAHTGSSNFIVKLANSQGTTVEFLVNAIGAYEGSAARNVPAGQYLLNVEASGTWTVKIDQDRPTSGDKLPKVYDGKGQSAAGPFEGSGGGVRFVLKHSGSSNFIVKLLDDSGKAVGFLVNEIGASDTSDVRRVPKGVFYLGIEADGTWHIEATPT